MPVRIALAAAAIAAVVLFVAAACGDDAARPPADARHPPMTLAGGTPAEFPVSYVDEKGDMWVAPADGSGHQNVTMGRCPHPSRFYFSAQGDRVACINSTDDNKTEIRVFLLGVDDNRQLSSVNGDGFFAGLSWPGMENASPSSLWSSTGRYLAYVLEKDVEQKDGTLKRIPYLFIADANTGQILKEIQDGQQPRWSAKGDRLAYNEPPEDSLKLYDAATGKGERVGGPMRPLAWVLNDTSLLVAGTDPKSSSQSLTYYAFLIDLRNPGLTSVPELDNNRRFWVSPDGTKVAYDGGNLLDLSTLQCDPCALRIGSDDDEYAPRQHFTFTSDGSRIHWYHDLRTFQCAISDGRCNVESSQLPGVKHFLGFSPDATQVLYLPEEGDGLWMANVDGSNAHLVADKTPSSAAWGPRASLIVGWIPTLAPTPAATPTTTATRSPTTPAPTATATPEFIDGVQVMPLRFGQEAELPKDVALIIETGCWECDGPPVPTGLYRVYRDAAGELRTDELFTVEAMGLPPRLETTGQGTQTVEPYIRSLALNSDASEIVVSVCTRGTCLSQVWASPDAQVTLYRSLDGGVTWEQFGVVDGSTRAVAITQDGVLLWSQSEEQPQPKYRLFPSGQAVQPPAGVSTGWPRPLPDGDLAWSTGDGRLLRSDGSEVLAFGENQWVGDIAADASGELFAVWWREPLDQYRFGIFSHDGKPVSAYSLWDLVRVGGWLSDTLLAGNVTVPAESISTPQTGGHSIGLLPAIFDLEAGEARPLAGPFLDPPFLGGLNYVHAVLHGPFARVVNTGSCLNVRAEPGAHAAVLACAADGVLLRDTGETREADGATWVRVVTPAGVEGWANEEYLER